ncbi:hypothetical protein PWG71_09870 [Nocardiopsis sp. N85]|uniref:DUF6891 domain-containing protein n=1 Tax=Nocardiopsis sp. N85 TaxID=3029400 RepID=UPI00237F48CB|nr:hypothetical protein [Nocardiopsis sp. N85]MDE3721694.1 hypothetical protein [Nocardiopsis sp. N85]
MSEHWDGDELLAMVRKDVAARVAAGRDGYSALLEQARGHLVEALPEHIDPDAPQVRALAATLPEYVDAALAEHVHRQRRRPSRTDSERLTRAFRALDESGILAREEFSCCNSCARVELHAAAGGTGSRGYAYYHWQDTLLAADGASLMIGFESTHPVRHAAVGAEVTEALRTHGLTVHWDGDPARKIEVDMDWSRRRHDRLAAFPGPDAPGEPHVEVGFTKDRPHPLPTWITRHQGRVSVRELARLVLPWLPGGVRATVTGEGGRTAVLERDFDLLRVENGPALSRERVEETLARWAVGAGWPTEDARSTHLGLLDVTYADSTVGGLGFVDHPEPLSTAAARDLVYRLTPADGVFGVFACRSGDVVQMMWQTGPRLWLESPSPGERLARGRHVTLPEAEEMVRVLADEGRIALDDLGALQVSHW